MNATANQDYQRDGKSYKIVQIRLDLARRDWRQSMMPNPAVPDGLWRSIRSDTADGSPSNVPIPSYARITNLANGRMIVVALMIAVLTATTALFRFLARH